MAKKESRTKIVRVPDDVLGALKENPRAKQAFDAFSPSHRREYVEWITEAKQQGTRDRRLATMLEWLTQGKTRKKP